MAWITKNSAAAPALPTNGQAHTGPYLSDALREHVEREVLPRYPTRRAATLPVLHLLQEEHGWLPYPALQEAGELLGTTPAEVYDTASFYEEFWLKPKGRYVIWVCQSIACELMGHGALIDVLRRKLGVEVGETTDDGKFTLMMVECIGACGGAPAALVNERLHEDLTPENVDQILDDLV